MPSPSTERNLLVGLLALQMGFLDRAKFIEAMRLWVDDRTRPIEAILRERAIIGEETLQFVLAMVEKHIELNGGQVEKSLGALSSVDDVRDQLRALDDEQLEATIQLLRPGASSASNIASSDATQSLPEPRASSISSRFRVLRHHARGGLGEVSVARDEELNREVALKEIQTRYADDPGSRTRFLLEAEITGALEHPGIVPVYSLGSYNDGRPFYAMRFVRGDSLREAIAALLARDKTGWPPGERLLELRRLLGRFIDVCDAISYAHSRGILHRDLKPGNIMLGKYGETLVVDWGLAKPLGHGERSVTSDEATILPRSGDSTDTIAGASVGTPGYMSPEQAEGRLDLLGPATDVYSLGATLYCILAGRAPLAGDELSSFQRRVVSGDIQPPSHWKPDIPKPLEAICLKALATRPEARYPNARALADDVERWLADEPVSVYREPFLDRASRVIRNHRTAFATTLALLVATAVALLVILVLVSAKNAELTEAWNAANEQRGIAVRERERAEANLEVARSWSLELLSLAEGLARSPAQGDVRRKITADTLAVLRRLHASQPNDPQLTEALARSLHIWANFGLSEDLPAAIKTNQDAVALLEGLAAKSASSAGLTPAQRDLLSELLRDQGSLWKRQGNTEEATRALQRSLENTTALRKEYPDSIAYLRTEATIQNNWASLLIQDGEFEQSLARATDAVAALRKVVAHKDTRPLDAILLVLAMHARAETLRLLGRAEELESFVAEAVEYGATLDQTNLNVRYILGRLKYELFRSFASIESRRKEALTVGDEVVERFRSLITDAPGSNRISTYRLNLARALTQRASTRLDLEQIQDARADADESLGLLEALTAGPGATVQDREAFAEALWVSARIHSRQGDAAAGKPQLERAATLQREIVAQNPKDLVAKRLLQAIEADLEQ